ncbi:MAG: hypothetical protein IPO91_30270 [Chloroflexi bacterium]|nr:hypothetical protein [Chloroflexota bacterium]
MIGLVQHSDAVGQRIQRIKPAFGVDDDDDVHPTVEIVETPPGGVGHIDGLRGVVERARAPGQTTAVVRAIDHGGTGNIERAAEKHTAIREGGDGRSSEEDEQQRNEQNESFHVLSSSYSLLDKYRFVPKSL